MHAAVAVFLILAFGLSWATAEVYYRLIGSHPIGDQLILLVYMWGPALAAMLTTRFVLRQPLRWLGPVFRFNRWIAVAIGLPFGFAAAYVAISPLLPGMGWAFSTAALTAQIFAVVPPDLQATVQAQLDAVGDWLPLVYVAQIAFGGLISGLTITAFAAFGEELGWRGFLHRAWGDWPFWRRAGVVGVLWGLWHAPVILRGHNFPEHPVEGVAMMVLFCLLWAPIFEHVRTRAGCVLAAVLLHSMMNATAGASLFVAGGSDLLRGPAGLAGCLVLLVGCVWVAWDRRRGAHVGH